MTALQHSYLQAHGPHSIQMVDVGARWGATSAWFRLPGLARLYGFEPDAEECARLASILDPNTDTFFPIALGSHDGEATLHVTAEPACSSIYPPSEWMRSRFPSLTEAMRPVRTIQVPTQRLDTWASQQQIDRIDFIKLDTQGAELDILRGAEKSLDKVLGIEAEVIFNPLYDGQPVFSDVDAFLRKRGFHLWRLDSLAHYAEVPSMASSGVVFQQYDFLRIESPAGGGRLVWGNAVYFRDREAFTGDRPALHRLAILLEALGDHDGVDACVAAMNR